jgi:hypothetical protein
VDALVAAALRLVLAFGPGDPAFELDDIRLNLGEILATEHGEGWELLDLQHMGPFVEARIECVPVPDVDPQCEPGFATVRFEWSTGAPEIASFAR